jgi:gluconolactonase
MRRLLLAFVVFPLACYAYACSDDPAEDQPGEDGGGGNDTGPKPGEDGGEKTDGSPGNDSGNDAGDGGLETCVGNPLTADGGGVDASVDDAGLKEVASGQFLDGPHYVDSFGGSFVYSEVFEQTIRRVLPDGGDNQPIRATGDNGIIVIGNASTGTTLFTAQSNGLQASAILRTNLTNGTDAGTLLSAPATSPNDLVVSKKGIVYFTDPGYQNPGGGPYGVYRLYPNDGGVAAIVTFNNERPDGIALSPNEDFLYIAHDTRAIVKHAVDANGNVAQASTPVYTTVDLPVGIAVDTGGNLWIAESAANLAPGGRVEVIDPAGKKWGEFRFTLPRPTNIAFGGPDNKTIAITTEQGAAVASPLYIMKSRCAGLR